VTERLSTAAQRQLAREAGFVLARRSLPEFCALTDPRFELTRHAKAILEAEEALEKREIDRLMIFIPPRHGKTYLGSERLPAWWLGRQPTANIILASYGAELAERNSRRARELFRSASWPFTTRLSEDTFAVNRWSTTDGGTLVATGIGGGLTGFGGDALLIDDPVRDRDAADSLAVRESTWTWYQEVARTRLSARGVQGIWQTRWHDDDLAGRILNSKGAKHWTLLVLPAIAEEADALGRAVGEILWPDGPKLPSVEDGEISSRGFAALYQQRPAPAEGHLFKAAWLEQRWTSIPDDARIIQAIDGAWKTGVANDFSVIATWAGTKTHYHLVDVWRQRVELPGLIAAAGAQFDRHSPSEILVEDAASGTGLLQVLKSETNLPVIAVPARGSKESRAEAVTPAFESGRVLLPSTTSPWLDIWIDEHLRFPTAEHDDTVDTTAMALARLQRSGSSVSWGKISVKVPEISIWR